MLSLKTAKFTSLENLYEYSIPFAIILCSIFDYSQEVEEARAALHVQSASVELLQNQLKELQEQLNNEEKAREHARMLKWLDFVQNGIVLQVCTHFWLRNHSLFCLLYDCLHSIVLFHQNTV